MELGQITVADIVLLIIGTLLGGGGLAWLVITKRTDNKNTVKNNRAGGNIAGGNILAKQSGGKEFSTNKNIVKGNVAGGDITGGNIHKK